MNLAFFQRKGIEDDTSATGRDIFLLPLDGGRKPVPIMQSRFDEGAAVFSLDGRWLAYVSNESGRYEIYAQPFPGPGGKVLISNEGGREPVWARNGKELFYRNDGKMLVVDITTEPTFEVGTPKLLFEESFQTGTSTLANYDVTPDGQRFVMIQQGEPDSEPPQINIVLNWFEELKRLAPTD